MCDDVDLYDDLPVLNFGESITKIEEERQYFKEQLVEKEKDLQNVTEQLTVLQKNKKILEENISSLYKTAVSEIKRKDKIIEDLRREKDSIIFRRKRRQNPNVNLTPYIHKSEGRNLHDANTSEESQKNISTILYCSDNKLKESDEHHLKNPENVSCEKKPSPYLNQSSGVKDALNNNSDEKDCSEILYLSCESLSSCSSHQTSNQSKSPEQSCGKKSNCERERSLSSDNKSERKHRQSDNFSAHRTRHSSPRFNHRSARSYHEKSRRDNQHGFRGDNRNYYRDEYKDCSRKKQNYKVHSNNEFGGKYYSHTRRNVTPKLSTTYPLSPNRRYTESRYVGSRVGRNNIKQTDNVRVATQLKYKYSRNFRERSMSCTPVKRKGFIHKQYSPALKLSKSPTLLRNSIPMLNLEEKLEGNHFDNEHSTGSEIVNKPLPKHDVRNVSPSDSSLCQKQGSDNHKKRKITDLPTSAQIIEKTEVANSASLSKHSNKAQHKEFSNVKSGSKRKLDKVSDNDCNSQQNRSRDATKFDRRNSQSECALCKNNDCDTCKMDNTSNSSTNRLSVQETEVSVCGSSPKQSSLLAKEVQLSNKEKICVEQLPPRLSTTPPTKSFITLNISPSFEEPAIVKENKFSHCIFNEQCDFKRPKRKRFKMLLVTETKNEESADNKEKECTGMNSEQCSEKDSSEQQKFHSHQEDKSDFVKDCVSEKNVNTLNTENIPVKDLTEANDNSSLKGINTNEIYIVEKCGEVDVNPQGTVVLPKVEGSDTLCTTMNFSHESPHDKLLRHKSPNRKRKLDSICEELKANLEKKNVAECVVAVPACKDHNQLKTTEVVSNTTPNRIVIPKRRRRVPNLQDNVVQVLTQIKSTTP